MIFITLSWIVTSKCPSTVRFEFRLGASHQHYVWGYYYMNVAIIILMATFVLLYFLLPAIYYLFISLRCVITSKRVLMTTTRGRRFRDIDFYLAIRMAFEDNPSSWWSVPKNNCY